MVTLNPPFIRNDFILQFTGGKLVCCNYFSQLKCSANYLEIKIQKTFAATECSYICNVEALMKIYCMCKKVCLQDFNVIYENHHSATCMHRSMFML